MIIKFVPNTKDIELYVDPPTPAKNTIPTWYKNSTRFFDGNEYTMSEENIPDIKSCMPFFDALSSGYIQKTWFDIHIDSSGPETFLKWNPNLFNETFSLRPKETAKHMPKPHGSTDDHFIFRYPYSVKTPPGYSTLFTQPFNRFDSPFIAMSGIVDTDTILNNGNYPIFVRKNFIGVVPSGTPILQMIPFKREDWASSVDEFEKNSLSLSIVYEKIRNSYGFYKKNIWKKKDYS